MNRSFNGDHRINFADIGKYIVQMIQISDTQCHRNTGCQCFMIDRRIDRFHRCLALGNYCYHIGEKEASVSCGNRNIRIIETFTVAAIPFDINQMGMRCIDIRTVGTMYLDTFPFCDPSFDRITIDRTTSLGNCHFDIINTRYDNACF